MRHLLTAKELQAILVDLSRPDASLGALGAAVDARCASLNAAFLVASALAGYLESGALRTAHLRLPALFLLFHLYREHDLSMNPFLATLLEPWFAVGAGASQEPNSMLEKALIWELATSPEATAQESVQGWIVTHARSHFPPDANAIMQSLADVSGSPFSVANLNGMGSRALKFTPQWLEEVFESGLQVLGTLQPHAQPQAADSSLRSHMDPPGQHSAEILRKHGPQKLAVYKRYALEALQGPLGLIEQQKLLEVLDQAPTLGDLLVLGLDQSALPLLTEHNPAVAIKSLQILLTAQPSQTLELLQDLPLSLHSMEVVNQLATQKMLPKDFLLHHVSLCIQKCESIDDRHLQNRQVRLVCVFLTSLLRNSVVLVEEVPLEVQTFCISFSRIREAAALFRLLKT